MESILAYVPLMAGCPGLRRGSDLFEAVGPLEYDTCQQDKAGEILRFAEVWRERTGALPIELIFDSRLSTYANLARLNDMGIRFATVRRRSARMVGELLTVPDSDWRSIASANVGRAYRTPRILERTLRIRDYPCDIRQIAIKGLGHEKPTVLLTNQLGEPAGCLIDRYTRRMLNENAIGDAIDFFHMDALSAAVLMKIDLDIQLTLMASNLYRVLAKRVGSGFEHTRVRTLFRKLVRTSATICMTEHEIIVSFGLRVRPRTIESDCVDFLMERLPAFWCAQPFPKMTLGVLLLAFRRGRCTCMVEGSVASKSGIGEPAGCGTWRCRRGAEEWPGRWMRVDVGAVLVLVSGPTTCPGFCKTAAGSWRSRG